MPRATVIIIGGGPGAVAVRANLIDFAALGLIGRFQWAETTGDDLERGILQTIEPIEGGGHRVLRRTVGETLRAEPDAPVLLLALDDRAGLAGGMDIAPGAGFDAGRARAWARAIDAVRSRPAERVHLALVRLPLQAGPPETLSGFTTLVLSPEDSTEPGAALTAQDRADGFGALAQYAAPAVAGLAGLWSGSAATPLLDDGGVLRAGIREPGLVRLTRVFHRRIDTIAVEDEVRAASVDVTAALPRPEFDGGRRAQTGYDAELIDAVSEDFGADAHAILLTPLRRWEDAVAAEGPGASVADAFVADFFRDLFGGPRADDPDDADADAAAVRELLHGGDPRIGVLCGDPAGRAVGHAGIEAAAAGVRKELDDITGGGPGGYVGPATAAVELWESYVDTSLTLVDGTDRSPAADEEVAPGASSRMSAGGAPKHAGAAKPMRVTTAEGPAIVTRPGLVVPDPGDIFDGGHRLLQDLPAEQLPQTSIDPYDPVAAERYGKMLDVKCRQNNDVGLRALRDRFAGWRARHEGSFAWRFGASLVDIQHEAQARFRWARAEFEDADARLRAFGRDDDETMAGARRLFRVLAVVWLMLTVIIGYFTLNWYWLDPVAERLPGDSIEDARVLAMGPFPPAMQWHHGLFWFAAVTLGILGLGMVRYATVRRAIRERAERHAQLAARRRTAVRNMTVAASDQEKCACAYRQFLSWSAIIGTVICHPHGWAQRSAATSAMPQEGLPDATAIAEVPVDPGIVATAVRDLRARLYPVSWATVAYEGHVASARRRAGADGRATEGTLFRQRGRGSGSALDVLESYVTGDDATRHAELDAAWARVMRGFGEGPGGHRLTSALVTYADGRLTDTDAARFLDPVGPAHAADGEFLRAAMSPRGNNEGGTSIDPVSSVHAEARTAGAADDAAGARGVLSRHITIAQFGPPVPVGYLTDASAARTVRDTAAVQDPDAGARPSRGLGLGEFMRSRGRGRDL